MGPRRLGWNAPGISADAEAWTGGIHRTKHLYMYKGEPWRLPGRPLPHHPPPPEVEMRWLSAADREGPPSLLPHPEA